MIQPGQFVMLKVGTGFDPLLRRPFAAFRRETDSGPVLEIFYKVVGRGTKTMSSLLPGTVLEVLGPLGNRFSIRADKSSVLIVAGGMGIIPVRGLIEQFQHGERRTVHVFFGVQSAPHLLFREELEASGVSLHIATEDGTCGFFGYVTDLFQHFLDQGGNADSRQSVCYACGPLPFLRAIARITRQYQLPGQVSLESRMACGIGACLGCVVKRAQPNSNHDECARYDRVCMEGPVFDIQELAW